MEGADLSNARFYGADMRDAKLDSADLSGANLKTQIFREFRHKFKRMSK